MSTAQPATSAPPATAPGVPSWTVTAMQRADLQLIAEGGYAPLSGFMTRAQADRVHRSGCLEDGTPFAVAILLTVDASTASAVEAAGRLRLLADDGTVLGAIAPATVWRDGAGSHVGGDVEVARPSRQRSLAPDAAHGPAPASGRGPAAPGAAHGSASGRAPAAPGPIVAAQPTGFVDAATAARWARAVAAIGGQLLLCPAVGTGPEHRRHARIRSYRALLSHLPDGTRLQVSPSVRDPADRGVALLHALVARNAGATHRFVDHHLDVAGIRSVELMPLDADDFAEPADPPSGTLHGGVALERRRADPPRSERGFVVMFTGLSGSGKSTVAKALIDRLQEDGLRRVTLLDGDLVRRHLSSELGFSREHRDLNVRRIGYVASEIAKHGGIAVCAPIAPYDRTRREVREMALDAGGGFVLVHVATPLATCEARDVKGLYARARAGEVTGFTGIDDPYETPSDAELVVDTSVGSAVDGARVVLDHLVAEGWLVR